METAVQTQPAMGKPPDEPLVGLALEDEDDHRRAVGRVLGQIKSVGERLIGQVQHG